MTKSIDWHQYDRGLLSTLEFMHYCSQLETEAEYPQINQPIIRYTALISANHTRKQTKQPVLLSADKKCVMCAEICMT